MKKTFLLSFITFFAISCKTTDPTPEVTCSPTDLSGMTFTYDAGGKPLSAVISDIPVKFEYTGNNITKMTYSDTTANRSVTIEYDAQNRPVKAKKVYTSKTFNYNSDFVLTYDANGRLSTSKVDWKGDFEISMVIRLEYDANGNVLKEYLKENGNPEFVFVENGGFDNKKNPRRAIKLNPLHLFYEPVNLYDYLSENNPTTQKSNIKNSEYIGPFFSQDYKFTYTAYNENGYPTEFTSEYTIVQPDYSDPNLKPETLTGSDKVKYSYLCR